MGVEMKCNVSKMWSPKMPKGLDFEITHHPLTMKRVVNLIIAIERFQGSRCINSENLLNFMLESLVEEHIVFERSSAPPLFIRTDEQLCSVTDSKKRSLILLKNSMELHAVMLQGGAENRKVHLNMSNYVHRAPITEARTVALGIKDTHYYLSCQKDGDNVTLHLEAVEDKQSLSSIRSESDMVRFLFYKQDTGLNISTLVSVAFSDWYISTAEDNNKPVEMCLESSQRHRTFNIQHQS